MIPGCKIKNGVVINGAHFYPEMFFIIHCARMTAPRLDDDTVWITSANDGVHMEGSLHYKNRAFDIRTRNVTEGVTAQKSWTRKVRKVLGKDYDVVFEKDHIHVEYQPKS
jgi:hypothetical protein